METVQELSLEIKRLKKIIFEMQDKNRDDYLSYEEGVAFEEAMERFRNGETYTQEDIEYARKKAGLGI